MPESIRSLTACLSNFAASFFSAPRRKMRLPVTVSLNAEHSTGKLNSSLRKPSVSGLTADFSSGDINFLVPVIRIGENYFAGAEQRLMLEIETAERVLRVKAVAGSYELIGQHDSVAQYLIAAKITEMSQADREVFEELVKHGAPAAPKKSLFDAKSESRKASPVSQFFNF